MEIKVEKSLWATAWQLLIKVNIYLPYDPAITLLAIYSREIKNVFIKILEQIFIGSLFTVDNNWEQLKCLPTKE